MATAVPSTSALPAVRILIVDDDVVVRVTTQAALNQRGFDTVAGSSGAEALAYLARDTPALMLLDLNMDDMSGWEVMSEVQRNPRLRDMKIVIVSGEQSPKIPRRFYYMKKPFRLEQLFALLAGSCRHRAACSFARTRSAPSRVRGIAFARSESASASSKDARCARSTARLTIASPRSSSCAMPRRYTASRAAGSCRPAAQPRISSR